MKDNTAKLKQLISEYKGKESKEKVLESPNSYTRKIYEEIIQIFENNKADLEENIEQGAIDFKF